MLHPPSPLISILSGKKPSRRPVWFMRQAGRYLPEYREIRARYSMLDAIRTPEVAAEISLQPMRRFDLDAAIIFADILNPLMGMGIELDFIEKEGPKIFNPIKSPQDVDSLRETDPSESAGYTMEAIRLVVRELAPRGIPVLGFAGSPFTLSTYLIEGRTAHSLAHLKQFIASHPESWHRLQNKLCDFLVEYLAAQVAAGVSAVQLFDSWAGYLSPYQYAEWAAPYLTRLFALLRSRIQVPVVYFSTGTSGLFRQIRDLGHDGVSIDWRTKISDAAEIFGNAKPIQGNLDPEIMAGSPDPLRREVESILADARSHPLHIFNLGHGILPHTPVENVEAVVKLVHDYPV